MSHKGDVLGHVPSGTSASASVGEGEPGSPSTHRTPELVWIAGETSGRFCVNLLQFSSSSTGGEGVMRSVCEDYIHSIQLTFTWTRNSQAVLKNPANLGHLCFNKLLESQRLT